MKTSKRIMTLAEEVLAGNRSQIHKEFREIAKANGYQCKPGGWIYFGGDHVTRGWESFSAMVLDREIVLREPAIITETIKVVHDKIMEAAEPAQENPFPYPTRGLIPEVDAILDRRETEAASAVTYLFVTRTQTIPLSDLTLVETVIEDETTSDTEGECQSGAALNCAGRGFLRVLPESLLEGGPGDKVVQCVPCYEASAAAYARKVHHYRESEA